MTVWDDKLVEQMKAGNPASFEQCYRVLSPHLYTVIYKVCHNTSTAQELLHDTFLDIFQQLYMYQAQGNFLAWTKRIAFNNTISFLRRNNRLVLHDDSDDEIGTVEDFVEQQISDSRLLDELLAKVSDVERLVIWLFIVEQYSHEDIAMLMQKTTSYSKSIVSRALKRIRNTYGVKHDAYFKG